MTNLNQLSKSCYELNVNAGWWKDKTVQSAFCEKMLLIHGEISEAMEGYRKDLMDSHLPHRKAVEVELADTLIRIFDLAGAMDLDLDGAVGEKLAYNLLREDHKIKNRLGVGGKSF